MNRADNHADGERQDLPRILLFLKAPRPGTVKTRLAASVGEERAVRIYRILVERQVASLPQGWPAEVRYDPTDAGPEMEEWLGTGFSYRPQCGGDLGERIRHATEAAFSRSRAPVFCVGADCPDLGVDDFVNAVHRLDEEADLVFGPAADGGYYLLGLARFCPEIFEDVAWSTSRTLEQSLARARMHGRKVELLSTKSDVDELEDWEQCSDRLVGGGSN